MAHLLLFNSPRQDSVIWFTSKQNSDDSDDSFGHEPDLQNWIQKFNDNKQNSANMQFVHSNSIDKLCLQKHVEDSLLHTTFAFRVHPKTQVKASNQYRSGRCWMFAGLNILRRELIHNYHLKPDFELSESYLFFWHLYEQFASWLDLIGRRNIFKNRPESRANVMASLIQDGGNFVDFRNLVRQYGILPKDDYSETHHSQSPQIMRWVLNNMLRKAILFLDHHPLERSNPSFFQNQHYECFRLLCLCLGVPPRHTEPFLFQFREYSPSQPVGGALKSYSFTPIQFYESLSQSGHKQDDLVSLIHDPRLGHSGGWCTCEFETIKPPKDRRLLYNVGQEGIDILINAVIQSIRKNVGVWFACEVSENLSVRLEGMEKDLYDYESVLHCPDISMTKAERMKTWRTTPDHAMVIVGVDFKHGTDLNAAQAKDVTKFCVENSWSNRGRGHGYYSMGVDWFKEYVFQVVVAKSSLTHLPRMNSNMYTYPIWDMM